MTTVGEILDLGGSISAWPPRPPGDYEADIEWHTQEGITELVRIHGREIAQEKVANMLLIAFKETGR